MVLPMISIVVPVFNVKEFLEQCIESILYQTYTDFELLLIDDGSTDGCDMICDQLSESDSRIRVIHKTNGGLSDARNTGLDMARGKYILCVDSDDFLISRNALQMLIKKAEEEKLDILCFDYKRYITETKSFSKPIIGFHKKLPNKNNEIIEIMIKYNIYTSSACLKLIKRKRLNEPYPIRFEKGIFSEDIEWSGLLLEKCSKIGYIDCPLYAYRVRKNSISQNISEKNVNDILNTLKRMVGSKGGGIPQKSYQMDYLAFQYCTLLINVQRANKILPENINLEIEKLQWLLQYDRCKIVKLIHEVMRVTGYRVTKKLLFFYYKYFCY